MSVPLCRCRVLYIGSAVPTITKDGLQGIQQPLKEKYIGESGTELKGIDAWLSVWSNGILLEYVDGSKTVEHAFHPIQSLHYCAAVRYVQVNAFTLGAEGRFLPLDAPMAQPHANPNNPSHPPIFAAIFRRQTGVKVLECHGFICTSERAANALVRSCFHSYADTTYMRLNDRRAKDRSRSESPLESEQQASEMEPLGDEQPKDDQEWQDRAIDRKTWQWRQQKGGEYDTSSMVSSLYVKRTPKKSKKLDTQSEVYEHETAVVPFTAQQRRAGSQTDVRVNGVQQEETYYTFSGGPPGATFVPPPGGQAPQPAHPTPSSARRGPRMAAYPPPFPPPHFMKPHHLPPHMFPFPPPPPHFMMPPPHRPTSMPPPHLRFGFAPPPPMFPGFFPPPPPHFYGQRPRSPVAGDGPIITEAIYDTYPRRHFEEPIYGPPNGAVPGQNVYRGRAASPSQQYYEGYYDTYKSRQKKESDSDTSVDDSQFWEAYEAGAYKKPAPKSETLTRRAGVDKSPAPSRVHGVQQSTDSATPTGQRRNKEFTPQANRRTRPITPPADYERNSVLIESGTQVRQAAVF